MKVFIRTAHNYDMDKASEEHGTANNEPSMAKQSFAEEVDINTIVKRFGLTGELPTNIRMPTYGDFTEALDYHQALNAIARANEAFDAMPAEVRARFHNNPGEFVDFCEKAENREEAIKLGLITPQAHQLLQAGSNPALQEKTAPAAEKPAAAAPANAGA